MLSTNSAKSNEEQQIQQQQQQQQQETPYERPTSMPHQPHHQPSYNFNQQSQNLDECSNNLNFAVANNESGSAAHNKYLRIIQRSRINQQQQQQQYQQNIYQQQRNFLQQLNWLEQHENTANNTGSSNVVSNTGDMMYHNYNIQQSNKVGPKPNWRFRNSNEDYNPSITLQNTRHTAQPLQRYQNTLTFQQQQQALPQHFLNHPQQHQQQSDTPTQARSQDFLLRPAVDIDMGEVNYNFLNSQQQLPLDFSNPQQHSNDNMLLDGNENNEDEEEDEDDDTTSEEIKRNLLVNALKNDKFTTKFYESIKEDVFRRLESMLLDKNNINNESSASNTGTQNQLFNNMNNISLRKLNLNEQRDQLLQQQQQQFQSHMDTTTAQNLNEETRVTAAVIMNNETEQPLSSSNNDNDNENEKPEEDSNWRQSVMNNCNATNQTTRNNNTNTTVNSTSMAKNVTKKRKNLRKQSLNQVNTNASNTNDLNEEDASDNLRGACSLAAQQHQQLQQKNKDEVSTRKFS